MDTGGLPDDQFMAEIPTQPANTVVWYYVYAQDIAQPPNETVEPQDAPDSSYSFLASATGIAELPIEISNRFFVTESHPNPFVQSTEFRYHLPHESCVSAVIYNLAGQKVRTLLDERRTRGTHTVSWDARDELGTKVAAGVYFLRLAVHSSGKSRSGLTRLQEVVTRKLSVIR
jgi:hypothetical protein